MSSVPVFQEYMQPILDVLRDRPAPLPIDELDALVIKAMAIPADVAAIPRDPEKPKNSDVAYRMLWARTYLKKAGLLDNPKRGFWAITDAGRGVGKIDPYAVSSEVAQTYRNSSPEHADSAGGSTGAGEDAGVEDLEKDDEELFTARVSEPLARQLRDMHEKLAAAGALISPDASARCYRRFGERFGPDVLSGLDGEALLLEMHARNNKDSLVYWLEFKNDDDMLFGFGSIGGGSALKFGIYQAAETGQWFTGNSKHQQRLTIDAAVARARSQRDELVRAARVFVELPADSSAIDYSALQEALTKAAPELAESAWGHKYLSLLFPNVLPPIHGVGYQEHQLLKLLKLPSGARYENDRIFAGVARQLGMTLLDLATVLHERNGGSHRYWRVGTTTEAGSEWERMRLGSFAGVGWSAIGDISRVRHDAQGRAEIRKLVEEKYYADREMTPGVSAALTRAANQLYHFLVAAQERDIVVAMDGARVLGIGRIVGDYLFQAGDGAAPHRRPVKWLRVGEWKLPESEGLQTTFVPLKQPVNIVDVEASLLGSIVEPPPVSLRPSMGATHGPAPAPQPLPPLEGVVARVHSVLNRKRQVVLFGPPGTGKTYWAERAVEQLAARAWFSVDALDDAKRGALRTAGAIEICSFHPAYGYEDFLEGYRPTEKSGSLTFELRDGVFKKLCARAAKDPLKPYYLIIDEINRGDIPRIFGELLTVLEREKRGKMLLLPVSGTSFFVPDNVFVVGTMNTADRSIALLDVALRRRFGFVELAPDLTVLDGVSIAGLPLAKWVEELNRRIVKFVGRDARHLQVGHSYFMSGGSAIRELSRFADVLRDDVIPLLEEYCYEDFQTLERILGKELVRTHEQRIAGELFAPERHGDLIQKLLAAFSDITGSHDAAKTTELDEEEEDEEADGSDPSTTAEASAE